MTCIYHIESRNGNPPWRCHLKRLSLLRADFQLRIDATPTTRTHAYQHRHNEKRMQLAYISMRRIAASSENADRTPLARPIYNSKALADHTKSARNEFNIKVPNCRCGKGNINDAFSGFWECSKNGEGRANAKNYGSHFGKPSSRLPKTVQLRNDLYWGIESCRAHQ